MILHFRAIGPAVNFLKLMAESLEDTGLSIRMRVRKLDDCFHIRFSRPPVVTLASGGIASPQTFLLHSIDLRMHLEHGVELFSAASLYHKARSQKISAQFDTTISSAQGTLRASAQLGLYLYLNLR